MALAKAQTSLNGPASETLCCLLPANLSLSLCILYFQTLGAAFGICLLNFLPLCVTAAAILDI